MHYLRFKGLGPVVLRAGMSGGVELLIGHVPGVGVNRNRHDRRATNSTILLNLFLPRKERRASEIARVKQCCINKPARSRGAVRVKDNSATLSCARAKNAVAANEVGTFSALNKWGIVVFLYVLTLTVVSPSGLTR